MDQVEHILLEKESALIMFASGPSGAHSFRKRICFSFNNAWIMYGSSTLVYKRDELSLEGSSNFEAENPVSKITRKRSIK